MHKLWKPKNLPNFAAAAGIIGCLLRKALYLWGTDDKALLTRRHPLELLLWLVTALTLGVIVLSVRKLDGSDVYEDNFAPSNRAAVGSAVAGVGFLLTALLNEPMMQGGLGLAWKVLGLLSGPCLVLAGLGRAKGTRPFFAVHLIPCLFLVLHIINHYQTWSGNPQQVDYVFPLLGTMALMFFAYYAAAFAVDFGNRRMHLGVGLGAAYLCIVVLSRTEYLFLYAGGLVWALSDLCALEPRPRKQEEEVTNEPA